MQCNQQKLIPNWQTCGVFLSHEANMAMGHPYILTLDVKKNIHEWMQTVVFALPCSSIPRDIIQFFIPLDSCSSLCLTDSRIAISNDS